MQRFLNGRLLAATLVLVAVIGVAIALYVTRGGKLDAAAMTAYFPKREATVAYIDFGAIRSSGLLEKMVGSTVAEEPEYRAFVQQTGFDYKRDLDRAMVNSAGGIHYFLLEGRFDWDKLKSYAQSQGGSCKGDVCSLKGSTPERVISFHLLRKDLMALATSRDESGSRAIERRRSASMPFPVPGEPVWVHVPSDAIRSTQQMPSGTKLFAKALEQAERVLFTLGPAESKFNLTMDVSCRTAEEAATLRAQLEGLTQLLQKFIHRENQAPNPRDLSGVLTSGSFSRSEKHVVGKWAIDRAFFESLGGS